MTYTEYLQHLRLQKAEELLLHTRLTIDAIAAEVGYKKQRDISTKYLRNGTG